MDDHDAILVAVRDVLSPGGRLRSATGPLRANAELLASLDYRLWRVSEQDVVIEKLSIVEAGHSAAVVDLSAVVPYEAESVGGATQSGVWRFSGPIPVVREPSGWKVADLVLDGNSSTAGVFTSDLVADTSGVRLALLGGRVSTTWEQLRQSSQVNLYVESANETGNPLAVRDAAFAVRALRGRWRWERCWLAGAELPQGVARLEAYGTGARLAPGAEKRLVLLTDEGLLDLRPASAEPLTGFPLGRRGRPFVWGIAVVCLSVYTLVVGSAGSAVSQLVPVALLLLFGAVLLERRGVRRWALAFALGGVASAAAIGVLIATHHGTGWLGLGWSGSVAAQLGLVLVVLAFALIVAGLPPDIPARRSARQLRLGTIAAFAVAGAGLLVVYGLPRLGPGGVFDRQHTDVEWFVKQEASGKRFVSAQHALRLGYRIEWQGRGPAVRCVADIWAVTTTLGRSWVVVTNPAPATSAGSLDDLMLAYSRRQYPTAAVVGHSAVRDYKGYAEYGDAGYRKC